MNKLWRIVEFLKFYFKAKTQYNIHSPYLYKLIQSITDIDRRYYNFDLIERVRTKHLYNDKELIINDNGAGSSSNNQRRTISSICRQSTSNEKKCRLLHNIAQYINPSITIELGTNLGIASAYLQYAVGNNLLHTVEADKQLLSLAKDTFTSLQLPIVGHLMTFESFFIKHTDIIRDAQLWYIDGNHTYDGTMKAYQHATQGTTDQFKVLIFDDIFWSKGMKQAWEEIIKNVKSGYCINLFIIGIVIIDPEKDRCENIKFIPWKYKPFSTGLLG
jgi:hypothetical protein